MNGELCQYGLASFCTVLRHGSPYPNILDIPLKTAIMPECPCCMAAFFVPEPRSTNLGFISIYLQIWSFNAVAARLAACRLVQLDEAHIRAASMPLAAATRHVRPI